MFFCCALQFLVANISHTEGRDATNKAEFRSPKSVMSMAGMPGMAAKADEPSMQEKDWSGTKDHVNFTLLPQLVSRQEVAKILALMNGKEDNIDTATACLASFNYEQGRTLANVELDDEGKVGSSRVDDVARADEEDEVAAREDCCSPGNCSTLATFSVIRGCCCPSGCCS